MGFVQNFTFDYSEYDTSEFSSIRSNKINLGHGVYLKKKKKELKSRIFFTTYITI